ncbi:MAG: ribonuclease N1 [Acidobacteriota bacterium]|nr:ribonuclease N1 [Acidobacteriota bacterium]
MQRSDVPHRDPAPVPARTQVETRTRTPAPPPAQERDTASKLVTAVPDPIEREQLERTLALIDRGGPFPHKKDGTIFSNRERRLPEHPRGYYREYTVETPGATNRGARRVIRGERGETFYTRDHYRTFIRIDN